jgi:hypothetical protein
MAMGSELHSSQLLTSMLNLNTSHHSPRTLAAQPWSQVAIVEVVIWAMPIAIASPLVVIMTTCAQPLPIMTLLAQP